MRVCVFRTGFDGWAISLLAGAPDSTADLPTRRVGLDEVPSSVVAVVVITAAFDLATVFLVEGFTCHGNELRPGHIVLFKIIKRNKPTSPLAAARVF